MEEATKTILVLGAYGHAGSKIVNGLLEKTSFKIVATGRRRDKLDALKKLHPLERLTTQVLDTSDKQELRQYVQKTDMVINAVGPYSMGGFDIAKTILENKIPYIDLANEQFHLNSLRKIEDEIRHSGNMVFTGAGQSPGVSTLVMIHLAKMMDEVNTIEMFGVVGRLPTPDQTLGSIMSGTIEAGMDSVTYINGEHVHEKLGTFIKEETVPKPFGTMKMLSFPLNDCILVPETVKCKTVRTLFGLQMEIPPIIFKIIAFLKPHKRKWAYRLLQKMMKKSVKDNYLMGLKEGFNPGGYMKLVVNGSKKITGLIKVEDNAIMSSYMPIVIAKNYFTDPKKFGGLLTPAAIYTFDSFNKELDKLGWKITIDITES
ncbi:MAG TPA: saccharopine dehydrogenase NADP-binding domain-containing protein [Bacteroidia bacterium]|jgi:hypothetical protein|nr:saccharopine dehydrogenase NADP-binding domain-containing protein [Bacteroidia bacterium]